MSRTPLIIASIYLIVALAILIYDANQPPSYNWISLKGMTAFLVTFPVSVPLAIIGIEPDLTSKANVALLLAASGALIYQVVALIAKLFTSR